MKPPDQAKKTPDRAGRPRPIAAMLPKVTAKAIGKQGFTEGSLLTDWRVIVGDDLAAVSQPEKLAFPRGERIGGVLHIRVSGGVATELQHLEPLVVERINGHFGYGAVARLRLTQAPIRRRVAPKKPAARRPAAEIDPERRSRLCDMLAGVEDGAMRDALERLGLAILRQETGHENL